MSDYLTDEEVRDYLRAVIAKCGGQASFARQFGLKPQYVSSSLDTRFPISRDVLRALGITKKVIYQTKSDQE